MKLKTKIFWVALMGFACFLGGVIIVKDIQNQKRQLDDYIWAQKMMPIMKDAMKGTQNE